MLLRYNERDKVNIFLLNPRTNRAIVRSLILAVQKIFEECN